MKKGHSGLLRSASTVGGLTGFSRLLGLVREIIMGYLFGDGLVQSAFTVAFAIPNLFRRLFGEGALSSAFVPVFADSLANEGKDKAWQLGRRILTLAALMLFGIVAFGVLGIKVALTFATHFASQLDLFVMLTSSQDVLLKTKLVLELSEVMLPYMFFICLMALCMGMLNSLHHFAVPAVAPAQLNLIWILAMVFLCPLFADGEHWLFRSTVENTQYGHMMHVVAWAIIVAGVVQLFSQLPPLMRHGFRPGFDLNIKSDPRVRKVIALTVPAALGMGVFQINTLIDRILALGASDWGAASLRFAERLVYLPLGIFATALGTVLLPMLSHFAARKENEKLCATLGLALRSMLFVTVPAAVGLFVLAVPLVRLTMQWSGGDFTDLSTLHTARALIFYAPGLVVFSLNKLLVPAFYAMKDTRSPVRSGLWAVGINFILNVLFVITWPFEYKHSGLALATVISSLVNSIILSSIIQKRIGSLDWKRIATSGLRVLWGSVLMGISAYFAHGLIADYVVGVITVAKIQQILSVGGSILIGVLVYSGYAMVFCKAEIAEFRNRPTGKSSPDIGEDDD